MLLESSNSEVSSGIQQLRRIRRARTQYEKLQRPSDILPGEPIPSIEGWVVFLTHLPPFTTVEDIQDLFVSFKEDDPDYFGTIREVKIPLDKDCQCPGYALVELESKEGYQRALNELNNTRIPFATEQTEEMSHTANDNITENELSSQNVLLGVFPAFLAENDDEYEVNGNAIQDNNEQMTSDAIKGNNSNNQHQYNANSIIAEAEHAGSKRGRTDDMAAGNHARNNNSTFTQIGNIESKANANKGDNYATLDQISDEDDEDDVDGDKNKESSNNDDDQDEETAMLNKRSHLEQT